MEPMTTSQKIKIACITAGIRISDLAQKAGLHRQTLYSGREPKRETLKAVAAVLGVDWRSLLGD